MSSSSPPPTTKQGLRVSLACVECRSRHLRCDAQKPICSRCQSAGSQTCTYLKSRRGRKPKNSTIESHTIHNPGLSVPAGLDARMQIPIAPSPSGVQILHVEEIRPISVPPSVRSAPSRQATHGNSIHGDESVTSSHSAGSVDSLLELYYAFFHKAHPCVLPLPAFKRMLDLDFQSIRLLYLVVQFIGSMYTPKQNTDDLEYQVKTALADKQADFNGFDVQALILYSIAVYWRDNRPRARDLMNLATSQAVLLGMNKKEYAAAHSRGEAVIAESWRRTWWTLYIADAHMTATDHQYDLGSSCKRIPCTVELPCEDVDYHSGNIVPPRTLQDYDNREFALEGEPDFSSFAYLVGLIRSLDHTVFSMPQETEEDIKELCSKADASVTAWLAFLNKSKRRLFREDGILDEHIFSANASIQVYTVSMHRYLSNCAYSPIEAVSSCAPPPPPERMTPVFYRDAPLHTARVLRAMERLTNMLTMPQRMASHSPFMICTIAAVTICNLSACRFVLKGEQITAARERIRVAVGALEVFAEVWPGAKRIVREVKTVARELLNLTPSVTPETPASNQSPLSNEPNMADCAAIFENYFASLESTGYFDIPELETGLDLSLGSVEMLSKPSEPWDLTAF